MGIQEREVGIGDVAVGMFVCRLDRPWTETPFPLQGFMVRDAGQLELLREHCQRVWIDVERSSASPRSALERLDHARPRPPAIPTPLVDPMLHRHRYADTATVEQEAPAAREALDEVARLAAKIVDDVHAGLALSPEDVRAAAVPVVASVLRNADALFWVNTLRRQDGYAYSHAINCSALAAAFGRHLGMPEALLVDLASGALLLDIGKTRVPKDILNHPGPLNPLAMARARAHVELGRQILEEGGERNQVVLDMVHGHHERMDGSGYPLRKAGAAIPLCARMAGIIDSFDAMCSDRPHAAAQPRHDALQVLYRARDTLYHGELVEQFISCLGVYPTGSLVELATGEVAVVMAQNPSRRLRPRLMVLTDRDRRLLESFRTVDLMDQPWGGTPLEIRRPLAPGEFDVDLAELYL